MESLDKGALACMTSEGRFVRVLADCWCAVRDRITVSSRSTAVLAVVEKACEEKLRISRRLTGHGVAVLAWKIGDCQKPCSRHVRHPSKKSGERGMRVQAQGGKSWKRSVDASFYDTKARWHGACRKGDAVMKRWRLMI